jgi:hypothetical protein
MAADDEMIRRLREAARRKRPWNWLSLSLTALIFGVPAALILWLFWPWPHPPEMIVVAFDHVNKVGKPVEVRAALEPMDGSQKRWRGLDLFFEELAPAGGHSLGVITVRTDEQGGARAEWRLNGTGPIVDVEVRYLDEWMRPPWFDRARCRVFTWPADARLLVVDVAPTLKSAEDWPAMIKAFTDAEKAGWHLVYLAVDADTPLAYRKLRDWTVQQETATSDPLPAGPVLARQKLFGGETNEAARKGVLAALKQEFITSLVYVAAERALELHKINDGRGWGGNPTRLESWNKLGEALSK